MSTPEFSVESLKMLLVVAFLTLMANFIAAGTGFVTTLPGTVLIAALDLVALLTGRLIPLDPSAFVYAMVFAFALTSLFSPVQAPFLAVVGEIDLFATTAPILAYVGLSIGLQAGEAKEVSWRLVPVAVFVFFGTLLGSAFISRAMLPT